MKECRVIAARSMEKMSNVQLSTCGREAYRKMWLVNEIIINNKYLPTRYSINKKRKNILESIESEIMFSGDAYLSNIYRCPKKILITDVFSGAIFYLQNINKTKNKF